MYILYKDGTDTEILQRPDGSKEKNEFIFTGFSNRIHPYHKKEMMWVIEMLKSAGIVLNLKEVPSVEIIGKDVDKGHFPFEDLYLPKSMKPSTDGKSYFLIQDTEMGRGWAVFGWEKNGSGEIITQEHRDHVRDFLLNAEWLCKMGVSFEERQVEELPELV